MNNRQYVMVPVELKELLASMVKLHETRGTVLTVQMQQLGEMLAAAPRPVEQQSINHDWDDQDKCRRCGGRNWWVSDTCTPKQQTAPDVSGLVEALEAIEWMDFDDHSLTNAVLVARNALAAHQKREDV